MPGEPETLNDLLLRAAEHPHTGIRFIDRHERPHWASWGDILARSQRVCAGLQSLGLVPGERVSLIFPTGMEFFAAFFGCLLAGAVPVPLYPPVRLARLAEYHRRTARMLELVRTSLVLADRRIQRILGETVVPASPRLGCLSVANLPHGAEHPSPAPPAEPALVQYSSGTTVDPKPVALSHAAILAQARILNGLWPDTNDVRHSGVSWLPLYHDMGLIGCIFPALERPGVLNLMAPETFLLRPASWLRTISRYRATISPAPNFAYGLCAAKIRDEELEGVDLSCWRVALNGAEAVAPSSLRAFQQRFGHYGLRPQALTPVYGLSEASLAVTFSDLDRPFGSRRFERQALAAWGQAREDADGREIVSVGRPLSGFELQIRNGDRTELPEGRVGRVWVRGPSLMEGYLGQPELTDRVLRRGWLDTGDLGFQFRGELYLTGRAQDLIIIRGRNHSPEEVEQALDSVPGVRVGCRAAVSWLPDGEDTEQLLVLVERQRQIGSRQLNGLAESCRDAVLRATGLMAERVVVLEPGTLPRTSSGKIRRQEALRLYLAGELRPPNRMTRLGLLAAMARSRLAESGYHRRGSKT